MIYGHITDDMLAGVIAAGFPSMVKRLSVGELRWLWERYGAEAVDAAMYDIESHGSDGGEPFDEIRRKIEPRRPHTILATR